MSYMPRQIDERALPCVLPQISHSLFGGKYNSPFVRAYPPALSAYGIPETSFLAFVDGLNESFIANPALQSATQVGMGLSAFGGPHGHMIGKAVKMASKAATGGMSSKRTKVFLEEINRDMFATHGLNVEILPTYSMLQVIGCPPNQFQSGPPPPWETPTLGDNVNAATMQQQEESQMMRMHALDGYVMHLDYHVVAQAQSDDWLKRMGEKQAAKKAAKQNEKKAEDLADAHKKRNENIRDAQEKYNKDAHKYNEELRKLQEKLQDDLRKDAHSPGKQEKARRKYQEELQKLEKDKGIGKLQEDMQDADEEVLKFQRDENKEAKHLNWVVVTPVGWANQAQSNHAAAMKLSAGDHVKKHFIKSLFG
ncbi:hypothetical protein KCU83_g2278, partial [Aureobasidium melanogenum]